MRQVRWASGTVAVAMALALCGGPAAADTVADRAAAIVIYPNVEVDIVNQADPNDLVDTVIQLSNTSSEPVVAHCFYENANSHCSNTGQICFEPSECCGLGGCGTCDPGWNEVDFRVRLTPFQPLGWRASEGLVDFPLDGVAKVGRGGSSNTGSRVPPVPEDPFDGELKCIAVNEDGNPSDRNVLKGEATLEFFDSSTATPFLDVAKYNAVGVLAMEGAVNDDNILVLGGGDGAEYNGCPNVLILNHFFEFATNPVSGAEIHTRLILVPCTQDLLRQVPGEAVVQYLVYNEFEQRFSTSRTVTCKQGLYLSEIDTTQPERSIFSVGTAGTLAGQTRMTPIGSGLLGVADEYHFVGDGDAYTADFQLNIQGLREDSDTITLP